MRVLITGACGRIGSTLASYLKGKGHWVRGFDVSPPITNSSLDDHVTGSLLEIDALQRASDSIDGVVHLAALMTWHPQDNPRLFETNVTGTFQLLQTIKDRGLSRFVFASSGEVYPELNPRQQPITEQHPTFPTSPYGMTKLLGETMVKNISAESGLPYTILRFSHTQAAEELLNPDSFFSGPRFYLNAKIRQLRSLPQSPAITKTLEDLEGLATSEEQHYVSLDRNGKPFRMGMCDVRDMVQGIELALTHENAIDQTFNIGARSSFDFAEAVRYLATFTGLPVVEAQLSTTRYDYETSVEKAIQLLGYEPAFDIFKMIEDAATQHAH